MCVNKLVWVPWLSWEEPCQTQRGGPAWCREAQFRIPGRVLLNALPGVAERDAFSVFVFVFLEREKRTGVLVVRILAMLFCQIEKKKKKRNDVMVDRSQSKAAFLSSPSPSSIPTASGSGLPAP